MGADKASMAFGEETMLGRSVRILSEVLSPIIVVAAADQELPELPADVIVTRDRYPDRGPMEGLAVGLSKLSKRQDADQAKCQSAFVTTCDAPLIQVAFVLRLMEFAALESHDAVVPIDSERRYPLTSIYRLTALPIIEKCVSDGHLKVIAMLDQLTTQFVDAEEFRAVDPDLLSLRNVNSVEEYKAALELI